MESVLPTPICAYAVSAQSADVPLTDFIGPGAVERKGVEGSRPKSISTLHRNEQYMQSGRRGMRHPRHLFSKAGAARAVGGAGLGWRRMALLELMQYA